MNVVACRAKRKKGRARGYCAFAHSKNPEGWLRGSASLDRDTGILSMKMQIETDSTASAPRGKMKVTLFDADGALVSTVRMGKSAYRGGKPPGKAARTTFRFKAKIPKKHARRVETVKVKVARTGKYTRVFNIKLKDFIKILEDAVEVIVALA